MTRQDKIVTGVAVLCAVALVVIAIVTNEPLLVECGVDIQC